MFENFTEFGESPNLELPDNNMSEVEIINLVINKIAMANKNVQNILLMDEVSPNRFEEDNEEKNVSDWSNLIVSKDNIGKAVVFFSIAFLILCRCI